MPVPDNNPVPAKPNLGMQAAKASWVAPIVSVFLNIAANGSQMHSNTAKLVIGVTSFCIFSLGLSLGTFALMNMPRYGRKEIFAPALTGVIINGFIVATFMAIVIVAMLK